MSEILNLDSIEAENGTAQDGPGTFRAFVKIRATSEDGSVMLGQLNPAEMRDMALKWLGAAEAAEQDQLMITMLVRDIGLDLPTAANFISAMREERQKNWARMEDGEIVGYKIGEQIWSPEDVTIVRADS